MLIFFAEKMWVAFAVQKLLTFFQQNISEYCRLNPLKLNEMTLNELVKLTTLWTTGPRILTCTLWSDVGSTNHTMQMLLLQSKLSWASGYGIRQNRLFKTGAWLIEVRLRPETWKKLLSQPRVLIKWLVWPVTLLDHSRNKRNLIIKVYNSGHQNEQTSFDDLPSH